MPKPTRKQRLSEQLASQLEDCLTQWIKAYGAAETKRLLLPALARMFGDEAEDGPATPPPKASAVTHLDARGAQVIQLQADNARLQQELAQARVPSGLVARVERESYALGVPLAVDDRRALEALLSDGDRRTARTLGRLLVARAEQEAQPVHEVEDTTDLDPGTQDRSDQAERARLAQELLFQASSRNAPKGGVL